MAIAGYNSAHATNNVPFNNDSGQVINQGDMLYWNTSIQAFEAGAGIKSLSDLTNDLGYMTEAEVAEMIAELQSGGQIDLSSYTTDAELQAAISGLSSFSGDYNDLTNKPALFSGNYNDLTNAPDLANFVTGAQLNLALANIDYSNFVTDAELSNALQNIDYSNFVTEAELNTALADVTSGGTVDLSSYYTKTEVDALIPAPSTIEGISGDTQSKTLTIEAGWDIVPATDAQQSLGSPTQRFTDIYIDNSTINIGNNTLEADADQDATWNGAKLSTVSYVDDAIATALTGGTVDLSTYVTETELTTALSNYQPTVDLSAYALKTELFSGNYNDLVNAPTIPSLEGYASVAYVDSKVAQEVSSAVSSIDTSSFVTEIEMDSAIQTAVNAVPVFSGQYADLIGKPAIFSGSYLDLTNRPVLFNGDYNNLINKPDLSTFATEEYVTEQVAGALTGGTVDLSGYVTDVEMATAIGDALNTISHPTALSSFTNDAGYITDSELQTELANYQPTVDLTSYYTRVEVDNLLSNIDTSSIDLSGYATEAFVNQQIATATLTAGGISNLDDLNDVAIGSLPQVDRADEFYLLEYNPVNQLWESRDFGNVFATQSYVSATVATALTDGTVNLDGYATEQYVEQKLLERGDHFSGNYNDLVNTPILFSGDYRDLVNAPADNSDLRLMLVGDELQLLNIEPEPDTVISRINLDDLGEAVSGYIDYNQVNNLPNIFTGDYNDLVNRPNLFSGNYNDLANKPYIPSIAGLASQEYVDNRWAEPEITGDRTFTHEVVFEDFVQQKLSTVNSTSVKRDLVLAVQTTNDIETEVLFSDATRVAIASGTTAMFKATVVASSGTDKTAFIVRGVIDYTGTLSIVGDTVLETISDSEQGWTANLTADTVNEALKITVTGSPATTVDWTVFLEISEVIR